MSSISTIYSDLVTLLGATFATNHKQLVDPYSIEQNDDFLLNRGYGFYLGPANNTNRQLSCFMSLERTVVVTNTIVNRGTERDVTIRQTAEKTLLEDQYTLIKAVEKDPQLDSDVAKIEYISDNGIEEIFTGEGLSFLMIQTTFTIEYLENLN